MIGGLITFAAIMIFGAILLNRATYPPQPTVTNRVPVLPQPAVEPPQPSPKQEEAAPAAPKERDYPFYGYTFYDNETLTSVYYYPQGDSGQPDVPATHLKFNHVETDLWLCGDHRKDFEPGNRYRLSVTFELDSQCSTNWKKH